MILLPRELLFLCSPPPLLSIFCFLFSLVFYHNSFFSFSLSLSLSSFRNKCEILSHSFWRVNFYFHILSELLWVVIKGKEIICIEIVTSSQAASGAKLEILWSCCAPNHSCKQQKQEPLLCRGSFWISEVYSRICCVLWIKTRSVLPPALWLPAISQSQDSRSQRPG